MSELSLGAENERLRKENDALKAELASRPPNYGTASNHSVQALQRDRIRELEARAEKAEAALAFAQNGAHDWRMQYEREHEAWLKEKARVALAEKKLREEGFLFCDCVQSGPLWYRPHDAKKEAP